jgi:hypothetical protein
MLKGNSTMTRRIALVGLTIICGLASSCGLLDQHYRDAPPERGFFQTHAQAERALREWWEHRIDAMSPDKLAVYAGVSEVHRQHGSSATYCWFHVAGFTMGGLCTEETRLPSPPPDYAIPRMLARLEGYKPPEKETDFRSLSGVSSVEECHGCKWQEADALWTVIRKRVAATGRVGCTKDEAEALWKEAAAKHHTESVSK